MAGVMMAEMRESEIQVVDSADEENLPEFALMVDLPD
jgi:hypothetical protein